MYRLWHVCKFVYNLRFNSSVCLFYYYFGTQLFNRKGLLNTTGVHNIIIILQSFSGSLIVLMNMYMLLWVYYSLVSVYANNLSLWIRNTSVYCFLYLPTYPNKCEYFQFMFSLSFVGHFPLQSEHCLAWICLDVLFCTASIMHLCTISIDRYLSLRYPMRFGRNKTRKRVTVKIIFVWLLSIAMSLPLSLMYSKVTN